MLYPSGRYNLNFDICSILLCIFILFFFINRKNLRMRRIRAFFMVAIFMLLCSVSGLTMDIIRNNTAAFANWEAELATFVSHVTHNSIPYLLTLYFLALTGLNHGMTRRDYTLIALPEAVLIGTHVIPPIRYLLYYYEGQCCYVRGPWYGLYYAIAAFYIIYSAVILIRHYSAITKEDRIYVIILCSGFVVSMVTGMIDRYLRATDFIQSLFIVWGFFALENDDSLVDRQTRLYNTEALTRDAYPLFQSHYCSYVLAVKMQHFNYYRLMVGINAISDVMHQIGEWFLNIGLSASNTSIYRVSSGEFVVILFNQSEQEARSVAEILRERFTRPWTYSDGQASVTIPAQIWVSSIPNRIATEEQLLSFAESTFDDSLPQDRVYVDDEIKTAQRRVSVDVAIRRALTDRTFSVYYQPIYNTSCGKMRTCEALVRMTDPELGPVSPEEFIKIAEQTGTVAEIGAFVFEEVCRFLAEKQPEQYGLQAVGVNLSTIQCMDENLAQTLLDIMKKYNISPQQIVLEITESAVIHNESRMTEMVQELENAGFTFALDDFGTGHANYSYILKFPFRCIKIDKSFLWAADKNEMNRKIFENMLHLAQELKLQTVVEGVETEAHRDSLIHAGVNYLQGFFYSKALPEEQFLSYIKGFNKEKDPVK